MDDAILSPSISDVENLTKVLLSINVFGTFFMVNVFCEKTIFRPFSHLSGSITSPSIMILLLSLYGPITLAG